MQDAWCNPWCNQCKAWSCPEGLPLVLSVVLSQTRSVANPSPVVLSLVLSVVLSGGRPAAGLTGVRTPFQKDKEPGIRDQRVPPLWTDTQSQNITSLRATYAGGNNPQTSWKLKLLYLYLDLRVQINSPLSDDLRHSNFAFRKQKVKKAITMWGWL